MKLKSNDKKYLVLYNTIIFRNEAFRNIPEKTVFMRNDESIP